MTLPLGLLIVLSCSMNTHAAYRLHFRQGDTIQVESYEDQGDSIGYLRFGGAISVPKSALSAIEDLTLASSSIKASTSAPISQSRAAVQPAARAEYTILERRDVSDRRTARLQFKVRVPDSSTERDLWSICQEIIDQEATTRPLNTIEFLFYRPGTDLHGPYTMGRGYWAPDGEWGAPDAMPAGDYTRHALVISYDNAAPGASRCAFRFCPGDTLISKSNGAKVAEVIRVERGHQFPDGTRSRAYVVRTPWGSVMPLVADIIELMWERQKRAVP